MKEEKTEHLGLYIKRLRKEAELSQDELARKIGKSKSLIAFIEQSGQVRDKTLRELSEALKVPFEMLKVYPYIDMNSQNQLWEKYETHLKDLENYEFQRHVLNKLERIINLLEKATSTGY